MRVSKLTHFRDWLLGCDNHRPLQAKRKKVASDGLIHKSSRTHVKYGKPLVSFSCAKCEVVKEKRLPAFGSFQQ